MEARRGRASLLASIAAHGILVILLVFALHMGKVRPVVPESRCCVATLYWSPNASVSLPTEKPKPHQKQRPPIPVRSTQPILASKPITASPNEPVQSSQTSPQQLASMGLGSGDQNAEPALPVFRPAPDVADRSLLPDKEKKIVIEVEISALGDVTNEKLVQGLGNALDQVVMETVKGWRFRPATLNGTAIASVEDLVFPFNHDYQPDQTSS